MSAKSSSTENGIGCQKLIENANEKVLKRAQYEAFEFELEAPGLIRVINGSHENPDEHSYWVNIETDAPVACRCKSFQIGNGPCKHMLAVAIREPVLMAAQKELTIDRGQNPNTCENGQKGCCGPDGDELPCFECYTEYSATRVNYHISE